MDLKAVPAGLRVTGRVPAPGMPSQKTRLPAVPVAAESPTQHGLHNEARRAELRIARLPLVVVLVAP